MRKKGQTHIVNCSYYILSLTAKDCKLPKHLPDVPWVSVPSACPKGALILE